MRKRIYNVDNFQSCGEIESMHEFEFFRVKEHLYEIRWIWFIRK